MRGSIKQIYLNDDDGPLDLWFDDELIKSIKENKKIFNHKKYEGSLIYELKLSDSDFSCGKVNGIRVFFDIPSIKNRGQEQRYLAGEWSGNAIKVKVRIFKGNEELNRVYEFYLSSFTDNCGIAVLSSLHGLCITDGYGNEILIHKYALELIRIDPLSLCSDPNLVIATTNSLHQKELLTNFGFNVSSSYNKINDPKKMIYILNYYFGDKKDNTNAALEWDYVKED